MSDSDLESVVNDLTLAVGQLIRRLRSETSPSELNLSQKGVLARLERTEALTTADLARLEAMKPQSMGSLLASLEQEGLVHRQPHPTDGRQILFALTETGRALRLEQKAAKRAWITTAMARLSDEEIHKLRAAIPLIQRLGEN